MSRPRVFNSPIESAVRVAILLSESDRPATLDALVLLDYMLLHSGDVGGPPSLHPDLPLRSSELTVRRHFVSDGLRLLTRSSLVRIQADEEGVRYLANDTAHTFVRVLNSDYATLLRDRAAWVVSHFAGGEETDEAVQRGISRVLASWTHEFTQVSNSEAKL